VFLLQRGLKGRVEGAGGAVMPQACPSLSHECALRLRCFVIALIVIQDTGGSKSDYKVEASWPHAFLDPGIYIYTPVAGRPANRAAGHCLRQILYNEVRPTITWKLIWGVYTLEVSWDRDAHSGSVLDFAAAKIR
jgi:hypothetical protein